MSCCLTSIRKWVYRQETVRPVRKKELYSEYLSHPFWFVGYKEIPTLLANIRKIKISQIEEQDRKSTYRF